MLAQDSKSTRGTSLKNLGAVLIDSFIGANRWRLAAKSVQDHDDKGLERLLQGCSKYKIRKDAENTVIKSLKLIRKHRRLSVGESEQLLDLSRNKPQAELRIYFAPGSAEISPVAEPALNEIGETLARPGLNGRAFLLAGHTCRKGGVEHAIELSVARAEAIKTYLVKKFALDADALLPHGDGFRYLKNPKSPFASENHRFEIINLGE